VSAAGYTAASTRLADQRRHQVRLARKRMTWWIPLIFVAGLGVSAYGLVPSLTVFREGRSVGYVVLFGVFTVFFGWAVVLWLLGPFLFRPRVVPCFARELGPYGGETMTAFRRGRALYRESAALDRLAESLGVKPLSAFGFADDYYEQEVFWHPASEGLRTIEALLQRLGSLPVSAPDVDQDLQVLGSVVRMAADRGVDFNLVLRLHKKDSMQVVRTREVRQGSFW
jgi:hypothetical protein